MGLTLLLPLLLGCARKPATEPVTATEPEETGARVVESEGLAADRARTDAFMDTRPPVERPLRVSGLEPVPPLADLSASTCEACHPEIAAEWRVSVHAQAWIDPQYQAEIGKSDNRWLCLNCHTPLLTQQDRWAVGLVDGDVEQPLLVDNPTFDAALRDEGITCAACHVRDDGAIHGPGLADSTAPHPVVADPAFRSEDLCLGCHQAELTYPGKSFVCTFQTGTEWEQGPWHDEGVGCVDCHMPAVERPAAVGGPVRTVRRHWWRGSGIPKFEGRYPPPEANPPGLAVAATQDGSTLSVALTNANAGHRLPSGDPERWVQVDIGFSGPTGAVGEPHRVRIGQEWAWEPEPTRLSDNRLAPRETRTVSLPIPDGATAASVTASSHRISAENAAYHHLDDYPRSVVTHQLEVSLNPRP